MQSAAGRLLAIFTVAFVSLGVFCTDVVPPPPPPPPHVTPEQLVDELVKIYNDGLTRGASERLQAYEDLFPPSDHPELPGFIFRLQPADIVRGLPESWGLSQELAIHERMFEAQDRRDIYSLTLAIDYQPAKPLEFPGEDRRSWRQVEATNVNLRLLLSPDDGFEVNGGQANFITAPADDRWYLTEWEDLPRAGA